MRVLVTGNMGYIGPVVGRHLRATYNDVHLVGYDSALFAACSTNYYEHPERIYNEQRYGDVRDIRISDLREFDAIVHLAAVSNDPMGKRFEEVTREINEAASVEIAQAAAAANVRNFVFASSCSVYGFASDGLPRKEEDTLNPLTAYAHSKIDTEKALSSLDTTTMTTTSLRFATACGFSDRLRLDLVLNDFVASALTSKRIMVLSDGSPWRPLIHVKDMARAIDWAITRSPAQGGSYLAVNVGADDWNYQVRELAEAVAAEIPGTEVDINVSAPPDQRSYKVSFQKFRSLAPQHQPLQTLRSTIHGLREGLERIDFRDDEFRDSRFIRLKVLESHIAAMRLRENLRWTAL